ncbi:hypothetical protein HDU86_004573 [Geranomyces michiganensis]|nr:hypothetical protein HDU86_004573 [Geranomyces michiganensis]
MVASKAFPSHWPALPAGDIGHAEATDVLFAIRGFTLPSLLESPKELAQFSAHWESEIIAAVRRVAAQLKASAALSESVDVASADGWVRSLDQMFATVLAILKRTKDLGVDPSMDGAVLENLWRQVRL